jgi:hypothetical protein
MEAPSSLSESSSHVPSAALNATAPLAPRGERKRELLRHYKDNPPDAGVYAIRCTAIGHAGVQVHASTNVAGAINRARFQLRMRSHTDKRLQQQWQQHGEAAFSFELLDVLKRREDATEAQRREDLAALLALWREELGVDAA